MHNPQSQIDAYQEQVFRDIIFLLTPRLKYLKQLSSDGNNILRISAFYAIFYVFYHSLYDNLVVTLTWLFSEREERSLIWYLKQVREHSKVFTNYIAHPMQGALTGHIYVQNSPQALREQFSSRRATGKPG